MGNEVLHYRILYFYSEPNTLSGRAVNWVKAIEFKNWLFWGELVRVAGNARWKGSGKKKCDDTSNSDELS